jgi:hypothetical protein
MSPTVTLFTEELKATLRGRFAWLGAGVVLLAVGAAATIGTQDTWLDGYGIIAYFLVPLSFIPFAAGAIAGPRANRFVESVFTTPVERRDWLIAKVLVLLTLAAAYYIALVPMMLIYSAHVGVPLLLKKFLVWAPGLLFISIADGVLIGVLFIDRNILAPVATGMGIVLAYAGFLPLQELMVARGNGDTPLGIVTLLSPAVLLKNALGFTVASATLPSTTLFTWISLAVMASGAFVLAAWVFLYAQGVETWETTPRQRWTLALGVVGTALCPLVGADRNYDRPSPPPTNAPPIRALFARGGGSFAMASPGGRLPARCCSTILNRDSAPLGIDESSRRDLFILLPVDADRRIVDLSVQVTGDAGLRVTIDPDGARRSVEHLETRAYAGDLGPPAADGHRIGTGWVARVPVVFTPTRPWDIGGVRYPLDVKATYQLAGDGQPQTLIGRAAVEAEVSSAVYEMAAASSILPLACLGAAFARWRRTR